MLKNVQNNFKAKSLIENFNEKFKIYVEILATIEENVDR